MITLIDLNYSQNIYPLLSQDLLNIISKTLSDGKKVLVFFNKRGESNALYCKDCSYISKCPNCDISMTIHKYPRPHLLCHQCDLKNEITATCPKCRGSNMIGIGTGIQKIEENLKKIFPKKNITRLDSDKVSKEGTSLEEIKSSDLIVATQMVNTIAFENLGLVVIPLFEAELVIPEYDIEEQIYTNISYNKNRGADIIIQTYIPKNPLLKIIIEGNYNDFLKYTLEERERFNYPPFGDMVKIHIKSNSKEKVNHLSVTLFNKLAILNEDKSKIINFTEEKILKYGDDYFKDIIIRGKDLESFLENIEFEIVKNREIRLEWK